MLILLEAGELRNKSILQASTAVERRLIWEVAEVPQAGRRRVGRSAGLRDAAGGGVLGMHWALWFGGCLLRVAARCLAPICVQYE